MSTDSPELAILDVGHGSCVLVCDGDETLVVDAPKGSGVLLDALEWRRRGSVDTVLISHSDADHAGGLLTLLTDPDLELGRIYVNPNSVNRTELWRTLQAALRDARRRYELEVHVELVTTVTGDLDTERLKIEVLAPSPEVALSGVGGNAPSGRPLKPNSMSAVVRVSCERSRGVLLMGDLDDVGFEELLEEGVPPQADVLLFPHHGGLPGGADPESFARRVSAVVGAGLVVFSLSRGHKDTPRPAVISGVLAEGLPSVGVACTQLSAQCAGKLPDGDGSHIGEWPARGRATGSCCAGTLTFRFTDAGIVREGHARHELFVSGVRDALCRPAAPPAEPPRG